MKIREKYDILFSFESIDDPIFFPTIGFWKETIDRWHGEGLPGYIFNEYIAMPYYNFEYWVPAMVGTHETPGFFPPFMRKVIEEDSATRTVRDFSGKVYKEFKDGSSSIPQHVASPVESMSDFRKLKWRLDPDFPGRCINPVSDALFAYCLATGRLFGVLVSGLFGFHRHLLGFERLMYAYYDEPELIHAMSRQWVKLTRGVTRIFRKHYKIEFVNYWEDMAFRNGPMISPKIFREFMSPYYKIVIDDAKNNDIDFFCVDTDGECSLLVTLFEEVGVNLMFPFEAQAGMDILKVREKHPKMAIFGGLDKRKLAGSKEDIEKEVFEKVPIMLKKGGYIPGLDHSVPPDVSFENFKFYLKLLKSKDIAR